MSISREEQIRIRAFEIWEQEGRPGGRHEQHWMAAEREIEQASVDRGAGTSPGD